MQFVPLVVFTIIGGALADAHDRRRLLVWSTAGIAAACAAFVAISAAGSPSVGLVFVLGFVAWSSFSLGAGATRSLTARLVPLEQLPAAAALNGLYNNLGLVLGPAIAGVLIAAIGFAATYGVSLAGILVALVATYRLPPVPPQENAPRMTFDTIVDGFRYLRLQHLVLSFFLIDSLAMVLGMPGLALPGARAARLPRSRVRRLPLRGARRRRVPHLALLRLGDARPPAGPRDRPLGVRMGRRRSRRSGSRTRCGSRSSCSASPAPPTR